MAKQAKIEFDWAVIYEILKSPESEAIIKAAAEELRSAAGSQYEVITENQSRSTKAVIAVGRTDARGMFIEATQGTLARALSRMEQPWSR